MRQYLFHLICVTSIIGANLLSHKAFLFFLGPVTFENYCIARRSTALFGCLFSLGLANVILSKSIKGDNEDKIAIKECGVTTLILLLCGLGGLCLFSQFFNIDIRSYESGILGAIWGWASSIFGLIAQSLIGRKRDSLGYLSQVIVIAGIPLLGLAVSFFIISDVGMIFWIISLICLGSGVLVLMMFTKGVKFKLLLGLNLTFRSIPRLAGDFSLQYLLTLPVVLTRDYSNQGAATIAFLVNFIGISSIASSPLATVMLKRRGQLDNAPLVRYYKIMLIIVISSVIAVLSLRHWAIDAFGSFFHLDKNLLDQNFWFIAISFVAYFFIILGRAILDSIADAPIYGFIAVAVSLIAIILGNSIEHSNQLALVSSGLSLLAIGIWAAIMYTNKMTGKKSSEL